MQKRLNILSDWKVYNLWSHLLTVYIVFHSLKRRGPTPTEVHVYMKWFLNIKILTWACELCISLDTVLHVCQQLSD